jgi:hypothetical protein
MSFFSPDLGELTNAFNRAVDYKTEPTDDYVDIDVTVRVRLYGRKEDKQRNWKQLFDSQVQWGMISTDPPQIFGDLREVDGKLFANPVMLGHELLHILRLKDLRLKDPDEYEGL